MVKIIKGESVERSGLKEKVQQQDDKGVTRVVERKWGEHSALEAKREAQQGRWRGQLCVAKTSNKIRP